MNEHEIERRQWSVNSSPDKDFLKNGKLTLVTFPNSLKSITLTWSEGETFPTGFNTVVNPEIYGKLYYDEKPMVLNYSMESRIFTHSGKEVEDQRYEKNLSHLPCKLLILGKLNEKKEFQNLEKYEGQESWYIHIPYSSSVGGMYNHVIGTTVGYQFYLVGDEMSCTYKYNYYADLE